MRVQERGRVGEIRGRSINASIVRGQYCRYGCDAKGNCERDCQHRDWRQLVGVP